MRRMIGAAVIAAVWASNARADAPTVDQVKQALPTWTSAIALPFTYQGMHYDSDDGEKGLRCYAEFKSHGVIKSAKKLPRFVECVGMSRASFAIGAKPDVAVFTVKGASPEMEGTLSAIQDMMQGIENGYPAKLAKLAKKGGMFVSHFTPPPGTDTFWDEAWNLYATHVEGGAVKFDAIVVIVSIPSTD